ncbi:hypothetical protein MtrunA17_Chr8g0372271 [Medicago truncatula]|uniref:Uncharacterized protein n=1 Tax=Medicago truncatula TaxID=3880 RepID=G7LD08_MEDTR|nr:hypothetical protein MTR_8g076320 [Medicago truncatula]RHN42016.1 hypothetical protein MtrunA17_Chr8g0372271 [Medicago truncatula]
MSSSFHDQHRPDLQNSAGGIPFIATYPLFIHRPHPPSLPSVLRVFNLKSYHRRPPPFSASILSASHSSKTHTQQAF